MLYKIEVISFTFVTIFFWIIVFSPFISIVDQNKESLEEENKIIQIEYKQVRLLLTMSLLSVLCFFIYLLLPFSGGNEIFRIILMILTALILLILLSMREEDYED